MYLKMLFNVYLKFYYEHFDNRKLLSKDSLRLLDSIDFNFLMLNLFVNMIYHKNLIICFIIISFG